MNESKSLYEAQNKILEVLKQSGKKAEMALEFLYTEDFSRLQLPEYIKEGLKWLNDQIEQRKFSSLLQGSIEDGDEENE